MIPFLPLFDYFLEYVKDREQNIFSFLGGQVRYRSFSLFVLIYYRVRADTLRDIDG
jgi:hypothetical protein